MVPTWLYFSPPALGRDSLRLCAVWLLLAYIQGLFQLYSASIKSRGNTGVWDVNQSRRRSVRCLRPSLDPWFPSQVSHYHRSYNTNTNMTANEHFWKTPSLCRVVSLRMEYDLLPRSLRYPHQGWGIIQCGVQHQLMIYPDIFRSLGICGPRR